MNRNGRRRRARMVVLVVLITAGCTNEASGPPPAVGSTSAGTIQVATSAPEGSDAPTIGSDDVALREGGIAIHTDGNVTPFDRRLLGTNAPAWISPERLSDPQFHRQLLDMGTTVLRMPGGSWSDSYDWLACENADGARCSATWASRPSDFVGLLASTEIEGMWTVSFNGTAQEAAALVAFFNGDVDDQRVIGVDRFGRDWATVGTWARLRAEHGHPAPQRVNLWEVGNEVYGAAQEAGPTCAPWGWEQVWTCEPNDYVDGDTEHDGYLAFRTAMRAVDPEILVGAVGIGGPQEAWNAWGDEVIERTGDAMDFYVIHSYGYDETAAPNDVLARPGGLLGDAVDDARSTLDERNPERTVPIAITEYNLYSFAEADADGMMAEAISALFLADTIGQMAVKGVSMANQWNLINGATPSGSDYGIFEPDRNEPNPQYYALALWSRFGQGLLPVDSEYDRETVLAVYGGVDDAGTISILAINKTSQPIQSPVRLLGSTSPFTGTADVVAGVTLDSQTVTYNGSTALITDLEAQPGTDLGTVSEAGLAYTFEPYSITLLRFAAVAGD